MTSRITESSQALLKVLNTRPDLRRGAALDEILGLLAERRRMDLSDLTCRQQAELIATRANDLLPSVDHLANAIARAGKEKRDLIVKFGIDPTAADVHLGHAVPMILASRFQRMGHHVVFIVGDITAKIGDPSGRSAERPHLSDDDIKRNMQSYRGQVAPFFDFSHAEFRYNSEWLGKVTLPQMLGVLEKLPVSASLQREDFRKRLAAGDGLTTAELLYSVVMALDSVELVSDIEIGGIDQLLNMQMCRRVMESAGQTPEVIVTTPLIEGTDGSGAKMSKSKGNYVGLAFEPGDIFGKLMSIPDRLVPTYLRFLTELLDSEIGELGTLTSTQAIHPMGVKVLLASEVVSTIHGQEVAAASWVEFQQQFSRKRYSALDNVPTAHIAEVESATVAELLAKITGLVSSLNEVRRVAKQGGLKLVREIEGVDKQEVVNLSEADANASIRELVASRHPWFDTADAKHFIKCGRQVVVLERK